MGVLVLTQAIYWLAGVFVVIGAFITAWKVVQNDFVKWFFYPKMMTLGGCSYMVATVASSLIWIAIAVLSGFLMYGTGSTVALCVIAVILIAAAYPVALFLISLVTAIVVWLGVWVYYCIQDEINKARARRAKRKKAKEAKAQEDKTE